MKKFPDNIKLDMSSCSESPRREGEQKRMEECNLEGISNKQEKSNANEDDDSFSINDSIFQNDLLSFTQKAIDKDSREDLERIKYHDFSTQEDNLHSHSGDTLKQYLEFQNTESLEAENPKDTHPKKMKLRTIDFKVDSKDKDFINKELIKGNPKKREENSLVVTANYAPFEMFLKDDNQEKDNNDINKTFKSQPIEVTKEKHVSCDDSILLDNFLKTLNLNDEEKTQMKNICQSNNQRASEITMPVEKEIASNFKSSFLLQEHKLLESKANNNENKVLNTVGREFENTNNELISNSNTKELNENRSTLMMNINNNMNTASNKPSANLNDMVNLPDKTDKSKSTNVLCNPSLSSQTTLPNFNNIMNFQNKFFSQGRLEKVNNNNINNINNKYSAFSTNNLSNFNAFSNSSTQYASNSNLSNFPSTNSVPLSIVRNSNNNLINFSQLSGNNNIPPFDVNNLLNPNNPNRFQIPYNLMNQGTFKGNNLSSTSNPLITYSSNINNNSNYPGEINKNNYNDFSRQMNINNQSNANQVNRNNQQGFKLPANNSNFNSLTIQSTMNNNNSSNNNNNSNINSNNINNNTASSSNNLFPPTSKFHPSYQPHNNQNNVLPPFQNQKINNINNKNLNLVINSNNVMVNNPTLFSSSNQMRKYPGNFGENFMGSLSSTNQPIISPSNINNPESRENFHFSQSNNQVYNIGLNKASFPMNNANTNNNQKFGNVLITNTSPTTNQNLNNSIYIKNNSNNNNTNNNSMNQNYQILHAVNNNSNNNNAFKLPGSVSSSSKNNKYSLLEGQIRSTLGNSNSNFNNSSINNNPMNNDANSTNSGFNMEFFKKSPIKQLQVNSIQSNLMKSAHNAQPQANNIMSSSNENMNSQFRILENDNLANNAVPGIHFPQFSSSLKPNDTPTLQNDFICNYNEKQQFMVTNPVDLYIKNNKDPEEHQVTNNTNNKQILVEKIEISNIPNSKNQGYKIINEDEETSGNINTEKNNNTEIVQYSDRNFSNNSGEYQEKISKEYRKGSFQQKRPEKDSKGRKQSYEQTFNYSHNYATSKKYNDEFNEKDASEEEDESENWEAHQKQHFHSNREKTRNSKGNSSIYQPSNSKYYHDDYTKSKFDKENYNKDFYYDDEYDYDYDYNYNDDYYRNDREEKNPIYLTEEIEELSLDILRKKNDLEGYINSKSGSKNLQTYLEVIQEEDVEDLLELITPVFFQISNNQYGNYFITRFIEHLNFKLRKKIWKIIKKSLFEVCANEFGNHCVQSLINCLESSEEEVYINNLICPFFMSFAMNKFGTFILQKMLLKFSPENKSGVNKFVRENFTKLATNIFGVCVIKKYIISNKSNSDPFKMHFVDIFANNFFDIVNDQSGNYAVFCLLEEWGLGICAKLVKILEENVADLGTKKYSQAIILKCLNLGDKSFKKDFSNQLLNSISDLPDFVEKKRGYLLIKGLINYINFDMVLSLKDVLKEMKEMYSKSSSKKYRKGGRKSNKYFNYVDSDINLFLKDLLLMLEFRVKSNPKLDNNKSIS